LLETTHIGLVSLIVLLGSILPSIVGFGVGIITTPFLLLMLDPISVVVTLNSVGIILYGSVAIKTRSHFPAKNMIPMIIAGIIGIPVGVLVLDMASTSTLRIGISILLIMLTLCTGIKVKVNQTYHNILSPLVGFTTGVLLTGAGVGGPLIAVYLIALKWSKDAVRSSIAFFTSIKSIISIVGYGLAGFYTHDNIILSIIIIIPVLIGVAVGDMLSKKLSEHTFRQIVISMILVASFSVLLKEIFQF